VDNPWDPQPGLSGRPHLLLPMDFIRPVEVYRGPTNTAFRVLLVTFSRKMIRHEGSMNIPYTSEVRPDTGSTNAKTGDLASFLASEVMLFGGSSQRTSSCERRGNVASRVGNPQYPPCDDHTVVLISSSVTMVMAWASLAGGNLPVPTVPGNDGGAGGCVSGHQGMEYGMKFEHGLFPATKHFSRSILRLPPFMGSMSSEE